MPPVLQGHAPEGRATRRNWGKFEAHKWGGFNARSHIEQNFNRFDSLLHCRTLQDFAALQSELLRDNLESFLQCARRVAEKSVHVADESTRRVAENVERLRAAA